MLRAAVAVASVFLLAAGAATALLGIQGGVAAIVTGAILLLALTVERRGYKPIEDQPPGPGWQPTGERYHEPGSHSLVVVYFNQSTGKRKYVRLEKTSSEPS